MYILHSKPKKNIAERNDKIFPLKEKKRGNMEWEEGEEEEEEEEDKYDERSSN